MIEPVLRHLQTAVVARFLCTLLLPMFFFAVKWALSKCFPLFWAAVCVVTWWLGRGAYTVTRLVGRGVYNAALFVVCAVALYQVLYLLLEAYPLPLEWTNEWLSRAVTNALWTMADRAADTLRAYAMGWFAAAAAKLDTNTTTTIFNRFL